MNEIYSVGSLYKTTSSTFDPSAAGYPANDYTLAYAVTSQAATWQFWGLATRAYLVSDTPIYTRKLIA